MSVVDAVRAAMTLEVRWIGFGPIPGAMFDWLGAFRAWIEQREDRYLIGPSVPGLGVKIKGGIELDLKAFRGTRGDLVVPGGGRGRLELWEKWPFRLGAVALPPITGDDPTWVAIRKVRRRRSFLVSRGRVVERPVSEAELPGCSVELTEFTVHGETWWTLCLEACGEAGSLERDLRATAASLFRQPLPAGIVLDLEHSVSYPQWLSAGRWVSATTRSDVG